MVYISDVENSIRFIKHQISFTKSINPEENEEWLESMENVKEQLEELYNILDHSGQ